MRNGIVFVWVLNACGFWLSDDITPIEICMIELDEEKVKAFTYAVKNNYWYQMYIDGLPIWGRVGDLRGDGADKKAYIFTHKKFEIGYNGKHIVDVKLTTERRELLVAGAKIKFTYEVSFTPSTVTFEDRFNKYLDPTFFQHRVKQSLFFLLTSEPPIDSLLPYFFWADPLVQHFQQFHDGYLFGWTGVDDFDANFTQGLPTIQ